MLMPKELTTKAPMIHSRPGFSQMTARQRSGGIARKATAGAATGNPIRNRSRGKGARDACENHHEAPF